VIFGTVLRPSNFVSFLTEKRTLGGNQVHVENGLKTGCDGLSLINFFVSYKPLILKVDVPKWSGKGL
jgi:hypothetical protein